MREKDVFRSEDGLTLRILMLGEAASWVVDCSRCRMPFALDNSILKKMEPVEAEEYRIAFTDEELDERQRAIRDKRFSIIEPSTPKWKMKSVKWKSWSVR